MLIAVAGIQFAQSQEIILLFLLSAGIMTAVSILTSQTPERSKGRELAAVEKICSMVNRSVELQTIVGSVLDEVKRLLAMDAATFRLVNFPDSTFPSIIHRGFGIEAVAILDGAPEHARSSQREFVLDKPMIVKDVSQLGERDALAEALRHEGMQFFALYPIRSGNRILGTLGIASQKPRIINRIQETLINSMTEILGVAVANMQMRAQAKKLSEDLVALEEVNKIISQGFDSQDIVRLIVMPVR